MRDIPEVSTGAIPAASPPCVLAENQPPVLRAPWDARIAVLVMATMWTAWLFSDILGGAVAQVTAAHLSGPVQQALLILIRFSLRLVSSLFVLWLGVGQYHPLNLGLFPLSFRDWRRWVGPLVAACLFSLVALVDSAARQGRPALARMYEVKYGDAFHLAPCAAHLVVGAVLAPLCEELVFRGFLLPALGRHLPTWAAVLLSSVVFAAGNRGEATLLPVSQFIDGVVLGWLYVQGQSLWAPILYHSFDNVSTQVLTWIAARWAGAP